MTSLWFWRSSASRYSRNRKSKSEKMKFGKSTLKNSAQEVLKIGCQFKASSTSTKYALLNMRHMITLTCKSSCTNTNSNFEPSKWKTHKTPPPTAGIRVNRRGSVQLECDDPHRWKSLLWSRVPPLLSKTKLCFDLSLNPVVPNTTSTGSFVCFFMGVWNPKQDYWRINLSYKKLLGTYLVGQWLGTRLPMQGTQVWSLVQEDPTWRGATKPMHHNYWACALEPVSHNYWAHVPQLLSPQPQLLKPTHLEPCAPQQEKPPQWEARAPQWRPNAAKNK